jgi:hypothetical protein
MMRSTTREKRMVNALANTVTRLESAGPFADNYPINKLPVSTQDESRRRALVKELRAAEKQSTALVRRVEKIVASLKELPLADERLVK